jgi:phosphoesterase RecJ-like protein
MTAPAPEPLADAMDRLIDQLARCGRVLLTTHVRPDGDALGSVAAMALAMRRMGIASDVLLLTHLPTKYAFVFHDAGLEHLDAEQQFPASLDFSSYDAIVVCDTGTWSQLPGLQERIASLAIPKLVIDHHLTQEDWPDLHVVDPSAAAAGELVARVLRRWGVRLDGELGQPLFVAIASDTGWFQFANTTPATLRLAADLMELGIDTDRLYQLVYQNERAARVRLQARAMQRLELLEGERVAVMTLGRDDFAACAAAVQDTENLVNVPLQVRSVEVSMLLTDDPAGGPVRLSLRSKGHLDCAAFARQFGGGGHARAAGAKFTGDLASARATVLAAIAARHATPPHPAR